MEIRYFGMVSQNTGEDWDGVALRLSTANPALGGQHPELQPWRVRMSKPASAKFSSADFYGDDMGMYESSQKAQESSTVNRFVADEELMFGSVLAEPAAAMARRQAQVSTKGASVVFAVKGASDIASDNVEHRVAIATPTQRPSANASVR